MMKRKKALTQIYANLTRINANIGDHSRAICDYLRLRSFILFLIILLLATPVFSDEPSILDPNATITDEEDTLQPSNVELKADEPQITAIDRRIFDEKVMIQGYSENFEKLPEETILGMIKDDKLDEKQIAAAVRVFNKKYIKEIVSREKTVIEKVYLRRLARTDSPFVQVEIMYGLTELDRYRYFESMVPLLILKLNHYNPSVNELAFIRLDHITKSSKSRVREGRIVFSMLRKILFLERRRLANVREPSPSLRNKLDLVRWSIKVLGNEMLRKLPPEVINLL